MPDPKNDDLAKLLSGMAEGHGTPLEPTGSRPEDVHVDLGSGFPPPPPSPSTPPPQQAQSQPVAAAAPPPPAPNGVKTPPPPAPRGAGTPPPRKAPPAMPLSARPVTPGATVPESRVGPPTSRTTTIHTPPSPAFSRPAPVPAPTDSFIVSDDTEELPPEEAADDAVIVPAPTSEMLAHVPPAQHTFSRPMTRTNALFLKQTMIPVLLTLGLVCPAVVVIGFLSAATSPYAVLRQAWFAVPFLVVGATMLALAILTMLNVKHDLERQRRA